MLKRIMKDCIPYGIVKRIELNRQVITEGNVDEPVIYNEEGARMRVFYLQDTAIKYAYSFTAGRNPNYIFWDKDNVKLPVHFYTHQEMFKVKGNAKKRFGLLMEPEAMMPEIYERLYNSPEVMSQFDAVFTHSSKLIQMYPNARLYLGQGVWFGTSIGGGNLDTDAWRKKTKNVSMISSDKAVLESHRRRIEIAIAMKENPNVDTFGAFDGGPSVKVADSLTDYRFSIILENEISPYYFTEKVLNCFASMTIPIYAGAQNIGEFFNIDGIIQIDKYDSIESLNRVVNGCSADLYNSKLVAVKENYKKAQEMLSLDDWLYKEYKDLF